MGNDNVVMDQRVSDQIVVSSSKEFSQCFIFVSFTGGPAAYDLQFLHHHIIFFQEEIITTFSDPGNQRLILPDLFSNLSNACHQT